MQGCYKKIQYKSVTQPELYNVTSAGNQKQLFGIHS